MASQSNENFEIGTKVISEINDDAYDLRVEAHKGQLECRLSISVKDPDNSIAPAELIKLLKQLDISESVDLEQLAIFCTEAANGEDPQNVLIATGIAPTTGKDGYFELFVDTGDDEIELQEDESGRVDYKNIQAFTNVEPDQLLGTIYPPGPGTPGKTITGLPIPALEGKRAKLRAGDGVELRNNGNEVYSTKQGRVSLEKDVLSVVEEFVVSGDVDLKVGHISFNGFVEIKGDVLDDFNIKSTKGINVSGSVGACTLESDGPITVGSMAGLGLGKIIARGDVRARYINHTTIECWGDVYIENEVRNSTVKATGMVSVAKGLITGGRTVALEGIEAKLFGSRSGIRTQVTSGVYFPEEDRLNFLRTRLKSIAYQLKKIETSLPALQRKPLDQMRPALREAMELRMKILGDRQGSITGEQEELSKELAAFQEQDHPTANAKINALTSIKEGVVISLGEASFEVKQEINGPVSIIENRKAEGIRQLTMSPLKINAETLEEESLPDAANGS